MAISWKKIRKEYEGGNTDIDALAVKYKCLATIILAKIEAENWETCLEEGREKRLKIFKAIQDNTLKGLEKADSFLSGCDSLKEIEIHSKTIKTYKDVGLIKPEDIVGNSVITNNALDDLYEISNEDASRVFEDDEN
jgi:hypothetical protein